MNATPFTIEIVGQEYGNPIPVYVGTVRKQNVRVAVANTFINFYVANASSRALRGAGKTFQNFGQALAHYKSPEMLAFVQAVAADVASKQETPANVVAFTA